MGNTQDTLAQPKPTEKPGKDGLTPSARANLMAVIRTAAQQTAAETGMPLGADGCLVAAGGDSVNGYN